MAASETPSTTGEQPAGTAVRDLRVAAGIQLRDIARDTGISESHLSRFETGQRDVSPKTYHRIIAAIAATAVRSGQLKAYRLGSRYYVEPSDARAFLRSLADGTTGPEEDA